MRFVRKLCRFIFIIYEDKNVFSSNLICPIDHGGNRDFSNLRWKMKNGKKYRRFFVIIFLFLSFHSSSSSGINLNSLNLWSGVGLLNCLHFSFIHAYLC